ncbi:hypothetical protein S101395_03846 [Bacillus sonorensis]|uniref:Uncharacterized protein n=1 Tax=Bacillus sonorensis TaxID=119858 RepID=A0ABM6LLU1_9BACI|nr:hypothetical protein S101395_03846 [Bacillus sonorensis]
MIINKRDFDVKGVRYTIGQPSKMMHRNYQS